MVPVVIEVALNGVTLPERNPHVPRTPTEITADALRCLDAGAAVVHNHVAEFAVDGARAADAYACGWRPVLAARPDAILYPTIGFGGSAAERWDHMARLGDAGLARMAVLDPGSVNLGGVGGDGLPAGGIVYVNTFEDIRHAVGVCARHRLGPSISIFEPGFLRATLAWARAGRMPPGALVKLYFGDDGGYLGDGGAAFGLPPTRASLEAYLAMLEGCPLPWAVAVLGGDVIASGLARLAVERGGHLRVGLEDYAGPRTPTNEELVREAVAVARAAGRPRASPAEAARLLGLPPQEGAP
jgi:3-keto-5-aminohexanoate cleavage enzyme